MIRNKVLFRAGLLSLTFSALLVFTHADSMPADKPKVVKAAAPIYPPLAKIARQMGEVKVNVKIDAFGNVTEAHMEGNLVLLRDAAESAAKRWKFEPSGRGSKTRSVQLTFSFRKAEVELPESEITPIFVPPYKVEVTSNPTRIDKETSGTP